MPGSLRRRAPFRSRGSFDQALRLLWPLLGSLITGAGTGIGEACVQRMAALGHNLVLVTHNGCIDHFARQQKVAGGERESGYASCFRALLKIAGAEPHQAVADLREQVAAEQRDDSLEALDKIWEEEAVDFLQAEQQDRCPSQTTLPGKAREEVPVPLHWVDFKQAGPAAEPVQEVGNV